jgi:archaeosine-15-forming tRNA-guanine transglycosylase
VIIYIVLGLIILFFSFKTSRSLHYHGTLKRIFKDELIHGNKVILNGITYKIHYIPCSKNTQVRVNSYAFIELFTPKQQKQHLISVNLKNTTLILTSQIQTQMRVVVNENEERFFNYQEKMYASYIVPIDKLASFKESFND